MEVMEEILNYIRNLKKKGLLDKIQTCHEIENRNRPGEDSIIRVMGKDIWVKDYIKLLKRELKERN